MKEEYAILVLSHKVDMVENWLKENDIPYEMKPSPISLCDLDNLESKQEINFNQLNLTWNQDSENEQVVEGNYYVSFTICDDAKSFALDLPSLSLLMLVFGNDGIILNRKV